MKLKEIHALLNALPHYGQSETIEIAKGKNALRGSIKGNWKQAKRQLRWQLQK
jgi:hypothetical protein